jgi:hypothetical protein
MVPLEAVGNLHPEPRALTEIVFDLGRQVGGRDHDLIEPVILQQVDQELHERLVDDWDHRLGHLLGEGAHARPLATRENDGLHGVRR